MIYFVTNNNTIKTEYQKITTKYSLNLIKDWEIIQFDTETSGLDPHIDKLLCMQLGNDAQDVRIVIDTTTVKVIKYKKILENKLIIGHNLKFDLQFLYKYKIIPHNVYDTMIVEQFLFLGDRLLGYSLKDVAYRRLNIAIDKTVRGEIIWRGLDDDVIKYAAGDVTFLEKIMWSQKKDYIKEKSVGAKLECDFVPVIAYLEWCGIKLDEEKWNQKILQDEAKQNSTLNTLNDYIISKNITKYITIDNQGNLFDGYNLIQKCNINWDSSKQVCELCKNLGFNVTIVSKQTGKESESVLEKQLAIQKGIDDDFLKVYFDYKEASKVCSTYGQSYTNAINPITGRIHTTFWQLGAISGRMSCGSKEVNISLAKLKNLPTKKSSNTKLHCGYPQLQNLPSDEITRTSFICEPNNTFCSCDYSALESRLGADIYQDKAMLDEYLYGSGDIHSLVAKACFPEELKNIEVKDVKKLRPDLRKKAKSPEFAKQFGGGAKAIGGSLGISMAEAQQIADSYDAHFSGISTFATKGSKFVQENGYIVICKKTGHCLRWTNWENWKQENQTLNPKFWEKYKELKNTLSKKDFDKTVEKEFVSKHFKESSKWDRMALNSVTQGTGIIILKDAMINFFRWIVQNNLFEKVLIVDLVHDEACIEYPKELSDTCTILKQFMEKSALKYCTSLPIPAEYEVGNHWIH